MADLVEKSAPTITTFGAAVTKGKIAGDAMEAEEIISGIIGNWRHLVSSLEQELSEFAVGVTRASAHLVINWISQSEEEKEKGGRSGGGGAGGYTLPTDILGYLKNLDQLNREKDLERGKTRGTPRRKAPTIKPRS